MYHFDKHYTQYVIKSLINILMIDK